MFIYPYRTGSRSVNALSRLSGAKKIKREHSRFRGSPNKVVINWGCSVIDNEEVMKCNIINKPEAVAVASNKLTFFEAIKDMKVTPQFTTDIEKAQQWLDKYLVVCRTVLNGHSGAGIVIASRREEIVDAPLYVRYVKKENEYRVHVFKGQVIDVQQKKRRLNVPDNEVNWLVRNHHNGFIYARNDVALPNTVHTLAIDVINKVALDFGAVDIIYNKYSNRYSVLEINTAPGLEGLTVDNYAAVFRAQNWR